MTKKDYEQVIDIIESNMIVLHENVTNLPRMVLTIRGFSQVKKELKELVKGE